MLRALVGPLPWMHSPLTAECALAVSVIAALLIAEPTSRTTDTPNPPAWAPIIMVFMAAAIAYLPVLSMPLITDDYTHMRQISSGEAPDALGCLTHACGGPRVFRPLTFATYWAEWDLWRNAPVPRHAFDLLLHAACSVLFFLLATRLGVPPPFGWLAALLFAWNGIRPEAVAWPGARFDTLALLFSLTAALAVLRGVLPGGRVAWILSLFATAAACLSKESAYVLPLLLAVLLGRGVLKSPGGALIAANFGAAAAIFGWRWRVLNGIGGYVSEDGSTPTVLQFHAVALAKTFFARIWGILAFPVNWSRPPEWWLVAALAAGVIGFLLLLRSRPDRKRVCLCLAGVAIACAPPYNMLLIDSSLERSRYLDLATPAFSLLLVFACMGLPRRVGMVTLGLLVAFQLAALEHNLRIWRSVSAARYDLCRSLAERARLASGPVVIQGVPLVVDGVYWRNGLDIKEPGRAEIVSVVVHQLYELHRVSAELER